jgi:predicted O-methyltransferase YrrM
VSVTPELESLLDRLLHEGREHDAARRDRRERLRNVEPETARMLAVLVVATGARRVLELGTSNGYSTLWLADAVTSTGGRVTTVELAEGRASLAEENFSRAGLASVIELRVGDAGSVLASSPDDAWDLVFLDAERDRYVAYWPELVRSTGRPGLIAVDNVLSHADELVAFTELVADDDRVASALVPVGAGVLLGAKA